ncbi:MAG TPA: dipeptidase [Clostridia bacterium]|nr:dipeptidase [Clostridia bacterium]
MYVLDAHSDILADTAMKRERGLTGNFVRDHLPALKKGGIGGTVMVLWVEPAYFDNPRKRFADIIAYTRAELEELGSSACVVKSIQDIEKAEKENKLYIILGVEGLSGIGSNADRIYELYQLGVRHMSLTWNEKNDLATGIGNWDAARGLTKEGKKAITIMDRLGIIIDVSHLNEKSFWDVCEHSAGTIIASHSNARKICNVKRNLTDDQIMAIAGKRGVIGINSWSSFVADKGADINGLVRHIDYMAELVGIDHVGFGFDFCNYFESDPTTTEADQAVVFTGGMESCERVPQLIELLYKQGYSASDIEKIAYKNFRRVINEVLSYSGCNEAGAEKFCG